MPKVSVIVPNYNHSKYISKRIDSILKQVYQNFEIIILDDYSTDNSREIIKEHAQLDDRIKVVFNAKNSGSPFIQWHHGLELASGEYIWIAESDDFSDPQFLLTLVNILDSHPNVGVAYSQSWAVDEGGSIMSSYTQWTNEIDKLRWKSSFFNSGRDEIERYFCLKNTIPNASAVVFRKEHTFSSEYEEKTMRLSGDKIFWARILLQSDVAFVSEHYNFFRHHSNNARTKTRELEAIIDNFKWLKWLNEHVLLPATNRKKAKNRIYTWTAGYLLCHPAEIFTICKTHMDLGLDNLFYTSFSYSLLKEFVYRLTVAKYTQNKKEEMG